MIAVTTGKGRRQQPTVRLAWAAIKSLPDSFSEMTKMLVKIEILPAFSKTFKLVISQFKIPDHTHKRARKGHNSLMLVRAGTDLVNLRDFSLPQCNSDDSSVGQCWAWGVKKSGNNCW